MTNKSMHKYLSRPAQLLLGLVGLLGVANAALAEGNVIAAPGVSGGANTAWTVYAFGNAQAVADSFRALANFSASPTFQSLVSMIAVIGVLGVGMSGGFNPAMARRFIGYVVSVFIVCYVLFGVTNGGPLVVNVEVIDSVDMTWKAPVTVPAVVGIPASIVSSAGYKITQAIEASFALPTELKMSNGAPFNLAAAMVADASQARITDPNLASSLAYYTQDCFTIGVAQGVLKASTLINSTNFLQDIKYTSDNVMVNTLLPASSTDAGGTPDVVTCTEAWNRINTAVNSQGGTAADFLKSATAWSQTPALSVVNSAAAATAQWVSNSGITDGASMVKQAAVLSAFRGAYSQAAAQTGNSDFLTGIAMSQAVESQRTSWITGAEIFNKTMGYIFAILQVFVYAITPLVLMAALVPGLGGALLKNFMQILLWLAIWQPMLSIVNFIVVSMQQADLGGAFSSGTGSFGFTLSNMPIITEKAANLRAAASFVGTMVPALAWAMVKGSVDFSRVIGAAVGENFAQGAANTMTTGNYSLNQASMDSFTANKHSTAATGAWGNQQTTNDAVGSAGRDHGGTESDKVGGQMIQGTTSATMGVNAGTSRATQAQAVDNSSHSVGSSVADGSTNGASGSVGGGSVKNSGSSTGLGAGAGASIGGTVSAPGKGGGGNGQGTGSDGKGDNSLDPAVLGKQGADWLKLNGNLSGRVDASVNGNASNMNNFSRTNTKTDGGNHSETGTVQDNTARSASDGQSAGTTDGTNSGQSVSVTGVMSPVERARLHNAYQASVDNSNFLVNHSSPQPHSEVNTLFDKTNGAAPTIQAVSTERKADVDKKNNLAAEAQHLKANAEHKQHEAVDKSHAAIAKNSDAAAAAEAPAGVPAYKQFAKAGANVVSDVIEPAKNAYRDFKEKMEGYLTGGGKDAAPANGAPAANHAAAANKAPEGWPSTNVPHLQNDPRQALLGQPDGHQPQAPAQAPTANQPHPQAQQKPGQGDHPPTQTAQQAQPGNQPQQQPGDQRPHAPVNDLHQPAPVQGERHAPTQAAQNMQPGQQGGQPGQQGGQPVQQQGNNAGQPPGQHKPGNEQGQHKPGQGDAHQPNQAAQQVPAGNQPPQQGQQKPAQGDHPPTQAAQNAQAGNQPGLQSGQHKPGNEQGAHKPQGDGHQPAQVAQQPHGGNQPGQQQGQPGHQQPPGDARNPGQVASQTGNRPGEHPNGEQHLGQQGKDDARQPGQHDREREREQQARELAAANSAAQQLQQLQQQPPVAPPVPPVPEAPMQVAQAPQQMQQPGAEGQSGLPNVFSGEKASDGASQLQGQVQLAEQRAERLDNQRRGAEGILASAEGRRPSELPELINQARDLMRNA